MNTLPESNLPNPANSTRPPITDGRFTLYTTGNFSDMSPLKWLVDEVLPSVGVGVIYGASGVGKSFLCLDLVATVARGDKWFGHDTERASVVYIGLEGQSGFRRRVRAKEVHQGVPLSEEVRFVFDSFDITEIDNAGALGKLILDDGGADLIVIDTLNRASPGADENSSAAMGAILLGAQILQKMTGAFVLFVHHPGKDATRGLRGHSSLFAAMDAVIEVCEDGQLIRWNLTKSKDSEDQISHAFTLQVIELGNTSSGKAVTSCVVQEVQGAHRQPVNQTEPSGANQLAVLAQVRNLLVDQRLQSFADTPSWPDGFPRGLPYDAVLAGIKDTLEWIAPKHRQSRTKEALTALIRMGYLNLNEDQLGLPTK